MNAKICGKLLMADFSYDGIIERILSRNRWGNEAGLAEALGISPNTWTAYKKGKTSFGLNQIAEICGVLGVTPRWLLYGEEHDLPTQTQQQYAGFSEPVPDGFVLLPRLDIRASAGGGLVPSPEALFEPETIPFREAWLRQLGVQLANAQFIVAHGDSMRETIAEGDLLLIDRGIDRVRSDGVYVVTYNGEVKVKRVQLLRNGSVLLKSDNPAYDTEEVLPHEVPSLQVEGRVRWVGGGI